MPEQPAPVPNSGPPIWPIVINKVIGLRGRYVEDGPVATFDGLIADMQERDDIGLARYGVRLQAHNGRDALRDAYEEALDLCVYLEQYHREHPTLLNRQAADDAIRFAYRLRAMMDEREDRC